MRGASGASAAAIVVSAGSCFPGDGKVCEVQSVDGFGIAYYGGDRFSAESGFNFGKHRLVGKTRNHAVTVLSRDIFRGQNASDSRMCGHESVEVSETEARPLDAGCGWPRTTSAPAGISSAPKISVPLTLPLPSSRTSLLPTACPAWGDDSGLLRRAGIEYGA